MSFKVLDIGCGDRKNGDIGVDMRRTSCVDVVADVRFLPFKSDCFSKVRSSDVLEHFSHREVQNIASEWSRVLQFGGTFEVECPDLRARSLLFFLRPSWKNIQDVYGGQDYPGNFHKCGFSYKLLKNLLESIGITQVKRIIDGYKGIAFIPNCLHVKGLKGTNIKSDYHEDS